MNMRVIDTSDNSIHQHFGIFSLLMETSQVCLTAMKSYFYSIIGQDSIKNCVPIYSSIPEELFLMEHIISDEKLFYFICHSIFNGIIYAKLNFQLVIESISINYLFLNSLFQT